MILPADALLAASIIIRSSIILSLTGKEVGCIIKTSRSLTFSKILTNVLSLLNLKTSAFVSDCPIYSDISFAKEEWAFPLKINGPFCKFFIRVNFVLSHNLSKNNLNNNKFLRYIKKKTF